MGLGESDETVRKGIERLTGRCIIPILRPISPHPLRNNAGDVNRPDAERLLRLGNILKDMLDHHSLCTKKSRTMCLFCTGCDLTPYQDI
jgi:biotin synthase-related radical SAM superfamily protein